MSTPFKAFADEFYINMRLGSQMNLPHQRDTVLHFFSRVQKEFPSMTRFRKSEEGEFDLEESRSNDTYRWLSLEGKRLASGYVNPPSIASANELHQFVLELTPYEMGISPIELEYLDVLYGFDLEYEGNQDEIIAESLLSDSPLLCLNEEAGAKTVDMQPMVTTALSEDGRLQARIEVITRNTVRPAQTGEFSEDVISVYLTVRQYFGDQAKGTLANQFEQLSKRADELSETHIVPKILRPISSAISSRS